MRHRIKRKRSLDVKFNGQKLTGYEDKITGSKFWTHKGVMSNEFRDGIVEVLNKMDFKEETQQ